MVVKGWTPFDAAVCFKIGESRIQGGRLDSSGEEESLERRNRVKPGKDWDVGNIAFDYSRDEGEGSLTCIKERLVKESKATSDKGKDELSKSVEDEDDRPTASNKSTPRLPY